MSERHVEDRLGAYLDAQLDASQRHEIETHLQACRACRDELDALRELHAQLEAHGVPEPDANYWRSFATRVEERLPEAVQAPTPWSERILGWLLPSGRLGWARAATVVATVTLLAYVGFESFRRDEIGVRPPRSQRSDTIVKAPGHSELEPVPGAAAPLPESKARVSEGAPVLQDAPPERRVAITPPAVESYAAVDPQSVATTESGAAERFETPGLASARGEGEKQEVPTVPQPVVMPSRPAEAEELAKSRRIAIADMARDEGALEAHDLAALQLRQSAGSDVSAESRESDRLANEVRLFISAALEDDTAAAQRIHDELERSQPNAVELRQMKLWHDSREAAAPTVGRLSARSATPSTPSAAADLLALDALLWPRRSQPAFRDLVVRMATKLESASASLPQLRPRAGAYLLHLTETSEDADERARWQQRLEDLR